MNENYIYLTKRLDLLVALNNGITKNDLCELECFEYLDFVIMYSSHYWDILCKANLCDYFWTVVLSNVSFTKKPFISFASLHECRI